MWIFALLFACGGPAALDTPAPPPVWPMDNGPDVPPREALKSATNADAAAAPAAGDATAPPADGVTPPADPTAAPTEAPAAAPSAPEPAAKAP